MLETITEQDIQIGVSAENWQDAIEKSAAPLLQSGAIRQSYVDAMIASVHKNGPYFVLSQGFALAHARPECGVDRLALGFTTLSPGVAFGAGANDPVRLVVTLAATDNDSHLDLLGELAEVLMDEGRMEKLFDAPTPAAFLRLLMGG